MTKLKDINRNLFDKFGPLYYTSLAYLGIKGLDITSTSLYLHEQNNLNAEANDLIRDLMEQFGINAGLIIKNVPMAAIILGAAHMLNRLGPKIGLNKHLGSILTAWRPECFPDALTRGEPQLRDIETDRC